MHVPPSFQMTVGRFGAWRSSLGGLVACAALAWALWAFAAAGAHPALVAVTAIVLLVCGWAILDGLARRPRFHLRWDTQAWYLSAGHDPREAPLRGRLEIAIDAGAWMLLCFHAEGRTGFAGAAAWLPVQRRGHEARWHALRLTLYGARPVSEPLAGIL
jgi:hypothetical protein